MTRFLAFYNTVKEKDHMLQLSQNIIPGTKQVAQEKEFYIDQVGF